ncbi:PREDICTED: protein Skeletor, isoforms B/C-like isoform X2 [Priapulus caudatus]|uniref:Protein Skeletor, isoforms B/C-like isoform X2 n=1 Tax=Priapulus caudatus TaxID=37621 RepID=A0ABM1E213_PRICU|nr:PREDICTED: protein Skeletor, isoforms B/C-like isoform X2 [Priapulus caudatus]
MLLVALACLLPLITHAKQVDVCIHRPCRNGGTCFNIEGSPGYICQCAEQYTGYTCETALTLFMPHGKCVEFPCRNGGYCIDMVYTYKCRCPVGYTGEHCETGQQLARQGVHAAPIRLVTRPRPNPCARRPCGDYGTCESSRTTFTCKCNTGWTGHTCKTKLEVAAYLGKKLGNFATFDEDVAGEIYALDENTLFIKRFTYAGKAPDAFFWAGRNGDTPSDDGELISLNPSDPQPLKAYSNEDLILPLPSGLKVSDIRWLSVWCRSFAVNFGSLTLETGAAGPTPQTIRRLPRGPHMVGSGPITLLTDRTVEIQDFSYDGSAPDTFFYVGKGTPSSRGTKIPDENGSLEPLRRYRRKTLTLTLPEGMSWYDVDYLSVYCLTAAVNFGHVEIPASIKQSILPSYVAQQVQMTAPQVIEGIPHGPHMVGSGPITLLTDRTVEIQDFSYDGSAPDTFFYVGKGTPSSRGTKIPDENGSLEPLRKYRRKTLTLTLPEGMSWYDVDYLSVYCLTAAVNFGHVEFPASVKQSILPPYLAQQVQMTAPQVIEGIPHGPHMVGSGSITLLTDRTVEIQDFSYDGSAPDTFFYVGRGTPSPRGTKIPDENGSLEPLRRYRRKTLTLTLPEGMSWYDVDYLSVYCLTAAVNFGHVEIPASIKQTRRLPSFAAQSGLISPVAARGRLLQNCETFSDGVFNVAWSVAPGSIFISLMGAVNAGTYMSFGLSGSNHSSQMVGADVVVAWIEKSTGAARAVDYSLRDRSQCSGQSGVCPDIRVGGTNDVENMVGSITNGITTITFSRKLKTGDMLDKQYYSDGRSQFIIWGIGDVDDQGIVYKHSLRTQGNLRMNFGRSPADNCSPVLPPTSTLNAATTKGWEPSIISGKDTNEFTIQLGPSGGSQGYTAITGELSWGIAFYVNGMLIPELVLKRGETYRFRVETGNNPSSPAEYHPVYIADDATGGYAQRSDAERSQLQIYFGIDASGNPVPEAAGTLCEFMSGDGDPENYATFEAYKEAELSLNCHRPRKAGVFTWTPDSSTPDLVYYQCYQHRYLGWKIHVVDDFS